MYVLASCLCSSPHHGCIPNPTASAPTTVQGWQRLRQRTDPPALAVRQHLVRIRNVYPPAQVTGTSGTEDDGRAAGKSPEE